MTEYCPFCGRDPYEWVDVGVGSVPVAITCCQAGIVLFDWRNQPNRLTTLFGSSDKRRIKRAFAMAKRINGYA
jgi:hypothetical protein